MTTDDNNEDNATTPTANFPTPEEKEELLRGCLLLESIQNAISGVVSGFLWEYSNEGHDYWKEVYDKLHYYENLAKLKGQDLG